MTHPGKKKRLPHSTKNPISLIKNPHLVCLYVRLPGFKTWQLLEMVFEQGAFCNHPVKVYKRKLKFARLVPLTGV